MLHDPAGQAAWNGTFRIVIHAQAPIESDLGDDPLLGEVAWSWLPEALAETGAQFHSLNGTVTQYLMKHLAAYILIVHVSI